MRSSFVGAIALTATLLFTGCATSSTAATPTVLSGKPSESVQKLIDKYNLEIVDYAYAHSRLGDGTRIGAKAIFIDTRPAGKYKSRTIPSSINIPDTEFKDYVGQLDKTPKDTELLVYCGGWECAKSPLVGGWLKEMGFTNVKLYQAGEPEWIKLGYAEVGTSVVKAAVDKNSALIIDTRPYPKYIDETIPGAIAIPDTKLEELKGRLPIDKTTPIITFYGGWECAKSHFVAQVLIDSGYTNVSSYSAGMPAWKKTGYKTTKGGGEVQLGGVKLTEPFMGPVKKGLDKGSVDGEWFNANYKTFPSEIAIVDVRKTDELKRGKLPNVVHASIEENSTEEFLAKLPKDKYIIFHCGAGGRAMEAQSKAKDAGFDKAVYLDANVKCSGDECQFEINDALDPSDW